MAWVTLTEVVTGSGAGRVHQPVLVNTVALVAIRDAGDGGAYVKVAGDWLRVSEDPATVVLRHAQAADGDAHEPARSPQPPGWAPPPGGWQSPRGHFPLSRAELELARQRGGS